MLPSMVQGCGRFLEQISRRESFVRRYTEEERSRAVELFFEGNMTQQQVVDKLGFPTRQCLERWLSADSRYRDQDFKRGFYPADLKLDAVRRVMGGEEPRSVAADLGVKSAGSVYNWLRIYIADGERGLMPKKRSAQEPMRRPRRDIPDDPELLRRRCEELELENAVMKEMLDVLKVDPRASAGDLATRERVRVVDALRGAFGLGAVLERMGLPRSTYYHARAAMRRPDKYAELRRDIARRFADSRGRYGYRRIWLGMRSSGTTVSEKVVRRIMAEEGLVARCIRKRMRYSSYGGEITEAPPNILAREFRAPAPNMRWVTDITEMRAADGKVYLSPVIDLFDGMIVAWGVSRSPNALLANTMLERAISTLPEGARPIVHTDRGVHYRWDGWIDLMDRHGLVRSMSRKACSPDNAAAEGFFGRLKVEMYHGAGWERRTAAELEAELADYMDWYNRDRIKASLGGMSPYNCRKSLGLAA